MERDVWERRACGGVLLAELPGRRRHRISGTGTHIRGNSLATQGEGLDEARAMVRDAIELLLAERRSRGEPIPATGWALVEAVEIAA